MGLLDAWESTDPDQKSAILQGLLAGGFGAMAGRGTALQAWGQGGLAGLSGYAGAQQSASTKKRGLLQDQVLQNQLADQKQQQQIQALAPQFMTGGMKPATMDNRDVGQPGEAPIPGKSFDFGGYTQALAGLDPMKAIALQQSLAKPLSKFSTKPEYDQQGRGFLVDEAGNMKYLPGVKARDKLENVNGVWANPYSGTTQGIAPQDPNKPLYIGPNGQMTANDMYQKYELDKAKKSATNVSVKTDVKTGESLAAQVGPMMKDSASQAEAAVKQVDASQRIVKSLESNKLFVGPGAGIKLRATQIADTIGVGGADDAEKLTNTRSAIRGLAELTLQGRQQMKGQGAITESEGKLAERAMSGDITDLTAGELRQLAKASERVARFNYAQHDRRMNSVRDKEEFKTVAPFYEAPQMPAEVFQATGSPQGSSSVDDLVNKYRTK